MTRGAETNLKIKIRNYLNNYFYLKVKPVASSNDSLKIDSGASNHYIKQEHCAHLKNKK